MADFEALYGSLLQRVSEANRAKGQEWAEAGRVVPEEVLPTLFRARVKVDARGELRVEVRNLGGAAAIWYCGCNSTGYRPKENMCAHAWAALVAADSQGWAGEDAFAAVDRGGRLTRPTQSLKAATAGWKARLARAASPPGAGVDRDDWPEGREILYVIDAAQSRKGEGLIVQVMVQERKADGTPGKPKAFKETGAFPREDADRLALPLLWGADLGAGHTYGLGFSYGESESFVALDAAAARAVMPVVARTGRCFVRGGGGGDGARLEPLAWGDDRPWSLAVEVALDPRVGSYVVGGALARGEERRALTDALLVTPSLVVFRGVIEPADLGDSAGWLAALGAGGALRVPAEAGGEFVEMLYGLPRPERLRLPDELALEEVRAAPDVHVKVRAPSAREYDQKLRATLEFDYAGQRFASTDGGRAVVDRAGGRVLLRDTSFEARCVAAMYEAGFRDGWHDYSRQGFVLAASKLNKVVLGLSRRGWHVEAEGKLYRQPGEFKVEVSSGIDWFELHGGVRFGDQVAALPQLLAAVRKGDTLVQLDDGSFGMLPDEWLRKYGVLARMGTESGDHMRFGRQQVGLLDALLAAQPEARCDAVFEQARRALRDFEGIRPADPPDTFKGELRPYQREGLGWMSFLRQFSFGGCLADDMGLGKTVQVLAMLAARKAESNGSPHLPSLIVVPRSLVFNWTQEAARFAPGLRVLDHSRSQRTKAGEHLSDYDVVLTTYGTLRNDAAYLKDVAFDHVILDEAQAIKNASSEAAKAARLLSGRHRLALSGTPVQNHLGDLWSLFEFINPGMLGAASVLSTAGGGARATDEETRKLLSRALRPFILRRTKEQVARDLPEKLEQTIFCELEPAQRKQYDELKEYYRANLLALVARDGMNKAKIQILEALLRLRQAACHPGLIDKAKVGEASAKLDTLMPRLVEIAAEGHKALVFSQFTSFLAIVKKRLAKERIAYEYLDGKTKDRQARVDRFQTDESCKLFLISLKAGGVGLNLTAADYVFLLDPWWNPAAEAQAIDRTHRIGQTRQVFACRLIAKDTVEEKVLALQQTKRELADAIIGAENSVIGGMGRAELELLLS